jgi:beta-glucanase (GH16 family)
MATTLKGLRALALLLFVTASTARAANIGDGWPLLWSDEFNSADGTQPDRTAWVYETGYVRNNEMQYYHDRPENVFIRNGKLVLRAASDPVPLPDGTVAPVTSGSLYTRTPYTYGKFEASVKVPPGRGVWPAFWMLGANQDEVGWPWCGEIDIMENVGYMPNVAHNVLHYQARNAMRNNEPAATSTLASLTTAFNKFAAVWTPDNITLFVNDVQTLFVANDKRCREESWPYHKPFFVKLNLAIGGAWGGVEGVDGALFPAAFEVDYVRIYQPAPNFEPPACSPNRNFVVFEAAGSAVGVSAVADYVMASASNTVLFANMAVDAIGHALGLTDPNAIAKAVRLDAVSPYANANTAGKTRLLLNFSVFDVDAATTSAFLADSTKWTTVYGACSSWLQANVKSSSGGTAPWSVIHAGSTCPGCRTPNGAPQPMPYDQVRLPAEFPFSSYDFGGASVGYWDVTSWNQYGSDTGRSAIDFVDLTQLTGVAHSAVGYGEKGEWFQYSQVAAPDCTSASSAKGGNVTLFASVTAGNGLWAPGVLQVDFTPLGVDGDETACTAARLCPRALIGVLPTGGDWTRMDASPSVPVTMTCGTAYRLRVSFPVSSYLLDSLRFSATA